MSSVDPTTLGIAALASQLASRALSPVEVTEATLDRIDRYEPGLNAFIDVEREAARKAAAATDAAIRRGRYRGPLHGVPVAVKDLFAVRGRRTTFGSPHYGRDKADRDATVVARLRRAGAILIGYTNLDALAFGSTTENPHYGPTRNPWDRRCHAGGSSGGSAAAVASGMAFGALGSDTGVSIRQPAACCGIVGLKPTAGLVSRHGALPLSRSLDHIGPMTRSVADAALMLQVLAGYDRRDPVSVRAAVPDYTSGLGQDLRGIRIGVPQDDVFAGCDPDVAAAVAAALAVLESLGAALVPVGLPDVAEANTVAAVIASSEAAAYHHDDLDRRGAQFAPDIRSWLEAGRHRSAVDYLRALEARQRLTAEADRVLAAVDAVAMPTTPVPATRLGEAPPEHAALRWRNTGPFIVMSAPAISVPCGLTVAGLPVGLQIVGRRFDEAGVLGVAAAFERATPWHALRPDLDRG